jgi:hypothetical protein
MNANYGLFPPLAGRWRGREKKLKLAERALADFDRWVAAEGLASPRVTSDIAAADAAPF